MSIVHIHCNVTIYCILTFIDTVITDAMLDLYITKELFIYWEKLGKALHLDEHYLQEIYDRFPMEPSQRLRIILREWRDTTDNPSLDTLDQILKNFGLMSSIPDRSNGNIAYILLGKFTCTSFTSKVHGF